MGLFQNHLSPLEIVTYVMLVVTSMFKIPRSGLSIVKTITFHL